MPSCSSSAKLQRCGTGQGFCSDDYLFWSTVLCSTVSSSLMPLWMSRLLPVAPCEVLLLSSKPAVSEGNSQIKQSILLPCHKFQKLHRHPFLAHLWRTNHFVYNLPGNLCIPIHQITPGSCNIHASWATKKVWIRLLLYLTNLQVDTQYFHVPGRQELITIWYQWMIVYYQIHVFMWKNISQTD